MLYDAFGQRQIATLFTQLNQYHVVEEVEPRFQLSTDALKHLYVRSSIRTARAAQPAGAGRERRVAGVDQSPGAVSVGHDIVQRRAGLCAGRRGHGDPGRRATIGKPDTVIATFQGTAQVFQSALSNQPWLILAAVIAVYIVLGVLYESVVHPLTIISTLPSAGVGALLALILCGLDLSIMGMIGIILLIGIVKKNAIMMIDFALTAERERGLPPTEAIRQGCLLRFRPIMMTTMAALLGALPLALGTSAGAELRRPLRHRDRRRTDGVAGADTVHHPGGVPVVRSSGEHRASADATPAAASPGTRGGRTYSCVKQRHGRSKESLKSARWVAPLRPSVATDRFGEGACVRRCAPCTRHTSRLAVYYLSRVMRFADPAR